MFAVKADSILKIKSAKLNPSFKIDKTGTMYEIIKIIKKKHRKN
jgi:hypothetical protein